MPEREDHLTAIMIRQVVAIRRAFILFKYSPDGCYLKPMLELPRQHLQHLCQPTSRSTLLLALHRQT